MPKPQNISPVQIATRQGDGVGIVYMYGIVGQEGEWYLPSDEQQETITAMSVVDALNELSKNNEIIQLRINSPGGAVFEGEAIVTAIRNCSAEVHTYNDGVAASMAAGIWLAGAKRFMGRNATMMVHAPISFCFGNAVQMREQADILDKFTEASAEGMAELTEMSVEDITERFFADGKDHWMTYSDVEALGFLAGESSYEVAQTVPAALQKQGYIQLLQHFQATPPQERKPSLISRARNFFAPEQQAIITPENSEPVTTQELRDAIAAGDITLEQVNAIHQELSTPAPDPQQTLKETIQLAVSGAVAEAMAERDATIADLREQVQQIGDAPGAAPTGAGATGDPGTNVMSAVQRDASFFGEAARSGKRLYRNPSQQMPVTEG